LIERKEDYEILLRVSEDYPSLEFGDIIELIEALRKVARAASYYKQEKRKFLLGERDYDRDGGKPLDDALDALPDWITEE